MATGYYACASTGCTCCRDENRVFGPYRTREEADQRNEHNRSTRNWASQFARNGNHSVLTRDIEELPDGRLIIENTSFKPTGWATVFDNDDDGIHPDDL